MSGRGRRGVKSFSPLPDALHEVAGLPLSPRYRPQRTVVMPKGSGTGRSVNKDCGALGGRSGASHGITAAVTGHFTISNLFANAVLTIRLTTV